MLCMRTTSTNRFVLFSSGRAGTLGQTFNIRLGRLSTYGSCDECDDCIGVMGYAHGMVATCGSTSVNDGEEHLVVVTFDLGYQVKIYIDGELKGTARLPEIDTNGNSNFLGQSNHGGAEWYYTGTIRGLKVYSFATSAAQSQNIIL